MAYTEQGMLGAVNSVARGAPVDVSQLNPGMGYIEGMKAAKGMDLAERGMQIEEQGASQKAEKFGWDRQAHDRMIFIQSGLAAAAQEGGYGGAVDWLKTVDPVMAMEMENGKLDLDQKIMKTDVMKSLSENEKLKAKVEAYGIIGKLGSAVLRAPSEIQEHMYQTMKPMLEKVAPGAPSSFGPEAAGMFLLGQYQATPENILYGAQKDMRGALSNLEKIGRNIEDRVARGETPETSPALKSLLIQQQLPQEKLQQAQITTDNIKYQNMLNGLGTAQKQNAATSNMNQSMEKTFKYFNEQMDNLTSLQGSLQVLRTIDPDSPAAQGALGNMVATNQLKGVLTDRDYTRAAEGAAGLQDILKKAQSIATGRLVKLNPYEIDKLAELNRIAMQIKMEDVKAREQKYKDQANELNKQATEGSPDGKPLILMEALRFPSTRFDVITGRDGSSPRAAPEEDIKAALTKGPKTLQAFIKAYGYDPRPQKQQTQGGQ